MGNLRLKIAVDSGKYDTKAVLARNIANPKEDREIRFRTQVEEATKNLGSHADGHHVEFNGSNYSVGVRSARMGDPNSSKNTNEHKICIYTAIAILMENNNEADVSVAIGCPLDIYTNFATRTAYAENMLPLNSPITITVDGKKKVFTIVKASVFPESYGVIALNIREYKNSIVNVIDIGGLNVNGCQYQNLAPMSSTIFTENLGGNTLIEDLKDYIVDMYGQDRGSLQDNVIEDMIQKGVITKKPGTEAVISSLKLKKVKAIHKICLEKKYNTDFTETIFVGGTSELMKDQIKEVFNVDDTAFYNDPVFANVKGFLNAIRYLQ